MSWRAAALVALLTLPAAAALADDTPADAEAPATLGEALRAGAFDVTLRYRFETVDDDRFADSADASTLRTTLAYRSAPLRGWSVFIEAEDVSAIVDDDGYDNAGAGSLNNGVRDVPVIADPVLTDLNQVHVRWQGAGATVTFGRQAIDLGDQRFVGAVGWRQNHQTFDAARVQIGAGERTSIDYTYVDQVHRIFGDDRDLEAHLLFVPCMLAKGHVLTAYGFWLDYDDEPTLRRLSTTTYGIEYTGRHAVNDRVDLRFELEAAHQDDAADNPSIVDADYLLASIGGRFGPRFGVDVTWESLGDSLPANGSTRAFQTPLATLHKWNGWADRFLSTPTGGLETLYLRVRGKLTDALRWMVVYHDFQSTFEGVDYGSEIDAELVWSAPWQQTFGLKFASYDADRFSVDTEKLMAWTAYRF
ncbi:MAG: alginate export family protein [Acidobacteriota bacterium]